MKNPARGFTLLEVLVALIVVGFIFVEIGQGFDFGLHATTEQVQLIGRQSDLDSVDRLLRGLITRMDPGSVAAPPRPTGNSTSFIFTSELPEGLQGAPATLVDIRLGLAGSGRLLLRWSPHVHSGTPAALPPNELTLLTSVSTLRFAYFDDATNQGWTDHWSQPYLPRLVRVQLRFGAADPRNWPDITVAPMRERPGE